MHLDHLLQAQWDGISQLKKSKDKKPKKREQRKISKILSHNDNEVNSFLASDSYFNQCDRKRMSTYYESKQISK